MRPALHDESGESAQDGDLAQPDATDAAEASLTVRHESERSPEVAREPAEIEERDGAAAAHSGRCGHSEEPPCASVSFSVLMARTKFTAAAAIPNASPTSTSHG